MGHENLAFLAASALLQDRQLSGVFCAVCRGTEPAAWAGAVCTTPGGTRYQEGVTKPLVDRVVELEEKLVKSSMENATAKQVSNICLVWCCR